jgi:hypothetical protein
MLTCIMKYLGLVYLNLEMNLGRMILRKGSKAHQSYSKPSFLILQARTNAKAPPFDVLYLITCVVDVAIFQSTTPVIGLAT